MRVLIIRDREDKEVGRAVIPGPGPFDVPLHLLEVNPGDYLTATVVDDDETETVMVQWTKVATDAFHEEMQRLRDNDADRP